MDKTLLEIAQVDDTSKLPLDLRFLIEETLECIEAITQGCFKTMMKNFATVLLARTIKKEEDKQRMNELVEKFTESQVEAFQRILEQKTVDLLVTKKNLREKITQVCANYNPEHLIYSILPPVNETRERFVTALKERTDGMQSIEELKLMTDSINNQIQSYENERITLERDFSASVDKIEDICSSAAQQSILLASKQSLPESREE